MIYTTSNTYIPYLHDIHNIYAIHTYHTYRTYHITSHRITVALHVYYMYLHSSTLPFLVLNYMCLHVWMHTHIYTYVHFYIYTLMYTYIHIHLHIYTYVVLLSWEGDVMLCTSHGDRTATLAAPWKVPALRAALLPAHGNAGGVRSWPKERGPRPKWGEARRKFERQGCLDSTLAFGYRWKHGPSWPKRGRKFENLRSLGLRPLHTPGQLNQILSQNNHILNPARIFTLRSPRHKKQSLVWILPEAIPNKFLACVWKQDKARAPNQFRFLDRKKLHGFWHLSSLLYRTARIPIWLSSGTA